MVERWWHWFDKSDIINLPSGGNLHKRRYTWSSGDLTFRRHTSTSPVAQGRSQVSGKIIGLLMLWHRYDMFWYTWQIYLYYSSVSSFKVLPFRKTTHESCHNTFCIWKMSNPVNFNMKWLFQIRDNSISKQFPHLSIPLPMYTCISLIFMWIWINRAQHSKWLEKKRWIWCRQKLVNHTPNGWAFVWNVACNQQWRKMIWEFIELWDVLPIQGAQRVGICGGVSKGGCLVGGFKFHLQW